MSDNEHIIQMGIHSMSKEDYWMDECQQRDAEIARLQQELKVAKSEAIQARAQAATIAAERDGLKEQLAAERERCARVVESLMDAYPTDVFIEPPKGQHGDTIDACSARAIRGIIPPLAAKIRDGAT